MNSRRRTDRHKLISYYTVNEWQLFDLQKDQDEMESLFEWAGHKVTSYETVLAQLVDQVKQLREKYKDTTGRPVRLWPTSRYD